MIQGSQVFQGEFRDGMALSKAHSDEEPVLPFQTMTSQKVTYILFAVVTLGISVASGLINGIASSLVKVSPYRAHKKKGRVELAY